MAEWITTTINSLGYLGIGLLMFLENLFPPIPSELIMPLAGFTVAQGSMNFGMVVFAGVVGTMAGALPWYYAGRLLGGNRLKNWADRYGKWLGISSQDIQKSIDWFCKHGNKAVLLGRLVPGVRTLISIPAGTCGMKLAPFLIYSMIGTLGWVMLLTYAGYLLGNNYGLVEQYVGPLAKIVLAGILIFFILFMLRRKRRRIV
jgi:membrane protein DedA with SNARE-associated domain